MAITDLQAAQEMAAKYPDLHQSRQIAFGQNYLEDLEKGTGTSQYYTGFGLAPDWVTGAIGAPATTPVVQEPTAGDAQVASQIAAQDRDAGITGASAIQPTISDPFLASGAAGGERLPTMDQAGAIAAVTQPEAYNIPGTMPQTPVSGVWGPQDYLQPEPFVQDPTGMIPQLGSQEDPAWWESARDKFVTTGQDVGNIFTDLAGQGIDVAKMAGSAILNFIQPGLGLMTQMLPQDTPIDKFNREYALGGDLYQNVVSQVDDPKFEGRLEGYADDLIAGTGEGKDPFGKNTVSALGDYPEYATETYNELVTKAKQRVAEGKELSQFDKDRMEYYGHVSGLTGKTNVPGTPLMVDEPMSLDDIVEEQKAKNELAKITRDLGIEEALGIPDAIDTVKTIPVEETGLPPQDVLDEIAAEEEAMRAEVLANQEAEARAQREMQEQIAAAEAMEAARLADIDRVNREREARRAAAPITAPVPAHIIGGGGGDYQGGGGQPGSAPTGTAGRNPWGRAKGGLIRKQYGSGGIVDLL